MSKELRLLKCPCGRCSNYIVEPLFRCQCSSLPKKDAEELIKRYSLAPKLYKALKAARDHLDYCGYGDKWERECAGNLEEQIEEALKSYE